MIPDEPTITILKIVCTTTIISTLIWMKIKKVHIGEFVWWG